MLWHAISPSYGYVKAAHDIVRHPRLSSDAKILITYVQGLPERRTGKALSDHAKSLGITGRAYQKAKSQLKEHGFVHEWRRQGDGGLWVTDQLFSNVPLTDFEARRVRDAEVPVRPGARYPAVGDPGARAAGGSTPEDEEREENCPHPPSEAPAQPDEAAAEPVAQDDDPQVVEAERVLLSLRHASPQLHLGVREARGLSGTAADWLRRGVKAAELRLALVSALPEGGVRSAVGFVRHRLVQKMPEPPVPAFPALALEPPPGPPVPCEGDGPEHVFRPRGDETVCGPCAQQAAWEAHSVKWPWPGPGDGYEEPEEIPWRERFAAIQEQDAAERR
ncbi:hypothetical protein [Streptomyces sp. NPDC059783]|uniref:hypothetical protein n=1 Tax=Streptomyces sp. NPDC059783 TaxID=3346944 RepID=UPI00365BA599